jgi:hypothetical protein
MDFGSEINPTMMLSSRDLIPYAAWKDRNCLCEIQPFIVLPGFGKAFDVRRLPALWYKPENFFSTTHHIFIIGLGLARDDFIIRSFFRATLPYVEDLTGLGDRHVYIVNPDPATRDNYSFLLGLQHVTFLCERFSPGHVELMRLEGSGSGMESRRDG